MRGLSRRGRLFIFVERLENRWVKRNGERTEKKRRAEEVPNFLLGK